MCKYKRVFIFGAGFSRPAGMPLATDLLPLLREKLNDEEMNVWLDGLHERLAWLAEDEQDSNTFRLNIEELFHQAAFDIEVSRLNQHLCPVGRGDGPDTPWNTSESIEAWLQHLEEALRDVIFEQETQAGLECLERWARVVTRDDAVLTFNYDTLAERALHSTGQKWNHGFEESRDGIPVYKLHGSIDWIVAHKKNAPSNATLVFKKKNHNNVNLHNDDIEEVGCLYRYASRPQLKAWIEGRDLQNIAYGTFPKLVGIAGLGAYKQLHQIPGLGKVWSSGKTKLLKADMAVIVGFSMSDFDTFAKMQFADVVRKRIEQHDHLRLLVIDPYCKSEQAKKRFRQVFREVEFINIAHEDFDWSELDRYAAKLCG